MMYWLLNLTNGHNNSNTVGQQGSHLELCRSAEQLTYIIPYDDMVITHAVCMRYEPIMLTPWNKNFNFLRQSMFRFGCHAMHGYNTGETMQV